MRTGVGAVLLFVVGAVVAQLALFGGYLDYVKPGQGPLLVAAGVALAVLGLVGMFSEGGDGRDGGHAAPRIALLLVLPLVVALGVSPPPLGAFTAGSGG